MIFSFSTFLVHISIQIMSTKAIYEVTGKKLLNKYLTATAVESRCVNIDAETDWNAVVTNNPWLQTEVGDNSVDVRNRLNSFSSL